MEARQGGVIGICCRKATNVLRDPGRLTEIRSGTRGIILLLQCDEGTFSINEIWGTIQRCLPASWQRFATEPKLLKISLRPLSNVAK